MKRDGNRGREREEQRGGVDKSLEYISKIKRKAFGFFLQLVDFSNVSMENIYCLARELYDTIMVKGRFVFHLY